MRGYTAHLDWDSKNWYSARYRVPGAGLFPSIDAPALGTYGGVIGEGFELTMSADHEIHYTLDGSDPREYGSGNAVGSLYAAPVPLDRATHVKARARSSSGEWSALTEAWFVTSETVPVEISEVMYHPRPPQGGETSVASAARDFEFVEIRNSGGHEVWLAGLHFADGITFDFSSSSVPVLGPGEYAVVVRNMAAFTNRYGDGLPAAGEFQQVHHFPLSSLDDAGERIALVNALGRTISSFTYNDARSWPPSADGTGHSLVPNVDDAANSLPGLRDRTVEHERGVPGMGTGSGAFEFERQHLGLLGAARG